MAGSQLLVRAVALVLALCLLGARGTQANCVVKNQSSQPVVILPAVGVGLAVEVDVHATVVLPTPLQNCYVQNKHSGHTKGPVVLANGATYLIVDAAVTGEVNLCLGRLVGRLFHIIAVILVI